MQLLWTGYELVRVPTLVQNHHFFPGGTDSESFILMTGSNGGGSGQTDTLKDRMFFDAVSTTRCLWGVSISREDLFRLFPGACFRIGISWKSPKIRIVWCHILDGQIIMWLAKFSRSFRKTSWFILVLVDGYRGYISIRLDGLPAFETQRLLRWP